MAKIPIFNDCNHRKASLERRLERDVFLVGTIYRVEFATVTIFSRTVHILDLGDNFQQLLQSPVSHLIGSHNHILTTGQSLDDLGDEVTLFCFQE